MKLAAELVHTSERLASAPARQEFCRRFSVWPAVVPLTPTGTAAGCRRHQLTPGRRVGMATQ